MATAKTGNPKFYSRYSFSSVAVSSRNVKLRKRLDLAKMFPAGMGAIYSFEFSVGPSDNDNDQARLHYIGLSFSNPTLERIEGHREDAKSGSKKTLDYLGYAAAAYNERPGARNVERFQDLVEVMNIVSIFDLALMERYYIQTEKTMGAGASTYQSFDEMVNDRNFVNGRKFTTKNIPLNTEAGGQGGPILQNALRSGETSRVVTPEDIIFGALAYIEDKDKDVLDMRSKFMPSELKTIPNDTLIIKKYNLPASSPYDFILPYKVHYIIETFARLGAAHTAMADVLKKTVQDSEAYRNASGAEKSALIEQAKSQDKNYDEKFALQGYFQSLSAQKEKANITKTNMTKSYINVGYIARVIKISGYDSKAQYLYGDNPNYAGKFKNKDFASAYGKVYQTDTTKPTMFKYFAQGFLSAMFSTNVKVQDFLRDFDIQLSKADEQKSQKAINAARKQLSENQKEVMQQLAVIEVLEAVDELGKQRGKNIKIDKENLELLKSKTIKDITTVVDRVIEVLDKTLPGGLTNEEKIFLHARIRNIAFAFNVGKITTG